MSETAHFSSVARLQAMLHVEAALADAEASAGVIPRAAAEAIRRAARAELYDTLAIESEARRAGNLAIPLVRHLTAQVGSADNASARYVHWGATSQDIIDTALVLQLRESVQIIIGDLARAADAAAGHARRHAQTPMAGRTWLQQATPITFGLKAAGWLDALDRVTGSLRSALDGALVLQLGGASGAWRSGTGCRDGHGPGPHPHGCSNPLARPSRSSCNACMRARGRDRNNRKDCP